MFLRILAHPVLVNLNFHMPMIVDLSHPLIMLTGENGSGKSTLLHSIYYALKNEKADGFAYRWQAADDVDRKSIFLFDAEQHNPRMQMDHFKDTADAGVSAVGQPRPGDALAVPRNLPQAAGRHHSAAG